MMINQPLQGAYGKRRWLDYKGSARTLYAHRVNPLALRPFLLPACSLLAACAPTYLSPQSIPAEHTISVGGSASLDVVPDEACVELTVTARDAAMLAAHTALVGNTSALLADLRQRPGLVVEEGAVSYGAEYDSDSGGRSHLA